MPESASRRERIAFKPGWDEAWLVSFLGFQTPAHPAQGRKGPAGFDLAA
jgi:hypothetical protein